MFRLAAVLWWRRSRDPVVMARVLSLSTSPQPTVAPITIATSSPTPHLHHRTLPLSPPLLLTSFPRPSLMILTPYRSLHLSPFYTDELNSLMNSMSGEGGGRSVGEERRGGGRRVGEERRGGGRREGEERRGGGRSVGEERRGGGRREGEERRGGGRSVGEERRGGGRRVGEERRGGGRREGEERRGGGWKSEEGRGRARKTWKLKQQKYDRKINSLVKEGKVTQAEKALGAMLEEKVRPDTVTFNFLITGLSRQGELRKAFRYFNQLKKRGLPPSNHTYCSLFKACAELGPASLPILEKLISEVDRRDFLLNTIASNALIVAMATCGLTDEAFQVYFDLIQRRQTADVSTFTSLLVVCAGDGQTGLGRIDQVWAEMAASGIAPDLFCYNTLLRCLREAGVPPDRLEPASEPCQLPHPLPRELQTAWNQVVKPQGKQATSLASGKRSDKQHTIWPRGSVRLNLPAPTQPGSTQSNLAPLSLVVEVSETGWRWLGGDSVANFLTALRDSGLSPDVHTLQQLSLMAPDWPALLRELGGTETRPDRRTVIAAVQMQSQLGNLEGAEVIRRFGDGRGLSLGMAGWQAVAGGCQSVSQGRRVLEWMKEAEVIPDQRIYGGLLSNAVNKRQYEMMVHVMKAMRHSGVPPNTKIMNIIEKAVNKIPQNPYLKLKYNGFKGYYKLWRKRYPHLEDDSGTISGASNGTNSGTNNGTNSGTNNGTNSGTNNGSDSSIIYVEL